MRYQVASTRCEPKEARARRGRTAAIAFATLVAIILACVTGTFPSRRDGDDPEGRPVASSPPSAGEATTGGSETSPDDDAASLPQGRYECAQDIEQTASELLVRYRDAGGFALAQAGYLDLLGNVWSCTVQGRDWVDVCFVRQLDAGRSEVEVVRMRADEWGDSYGEEFG